MSIRAILRRHIYGINHKGEWCRIAKTLCQEGYCVECYIWQQWSQGLCILGGEFGGNKWHDVKTGEVREPKKEG